MNLSNAFIASSVTNLIVRLAKASVYLDSVPAIINKNHTAIANKGAKNSNAKSSND